MSKFKTNSSTVSPIPTFHRTKLTATTTVNTISTPSLTPASPSPSSFQSSPSSPQGETCKISTSTSAGANNSTSEQSLLLASASLSASVISPDRGNSNSQTRTRNKDRGVDKGRNKSIMKKKVIKERWICDICRSAAFDDYDAACLHEKTCTGIPPKSISRDNDNDGGGKNGKTNGSKSQESICGQDLNTNKNLDPNANVNADSTNAKEVGRNDNATDIEKDCQSAKQGINGEKGKDETGKEDNVEVDFEKTPMLPKKLFPAASSTSTSTSTSTPTPTPTSASSNVLDSHTSVTSKGVTVIPPKTKALDFTCQFENCQICDWHDKSSNAANANAGKKNAKNTKGMNKSKCAVSKTHGKTRARSTSNSTGTRKNLRPTRTSSRTAALSSSSSKSGSSPEVQIVSSKTAKASKKSSLPTAPIFLNARSKAQAKAKSGAATGKKQSQIKLHKSDQKSNDDDNGNEKTPRTIAFASIFQKKRQSKPNVNDATTDNTENRLPSPTMPTEKEQKAMLAEHRAAEFASKRRIQLQEEKERQKKREEVRRRNFEAKKRKQRDGDVSVDVEVDDLAVEGQEQIDVNKGGMSQDAGALPEKKQKAKSNASANVPMASIFQMKPKTKTQPKQASKITPKAKRRKGSGSVESPLDLTADTPPLAKLPVERPVQIHKGLPPKKTFKKAAKKEVDWKAYPPRFPNPSHVIQGCVEGTETIESTSMATGKEYNAFISSARYQEAIDSVSLPDLPVYEAARESIISIDAENSSPALPNEADTLYRGFSSFLSPCPMPTNGEQSNDEEAHISKQLWAEKYAMQSLPHDIYGLSNKEVAEDLVAFINDWKEHRQQVCEAAAEKAAKLLGRKKKRKKKSKRYEDDYDDDDFFSDDEDGGLRNVYLLTGETGSGKTSLVKAAAKHCHCVLIEINTAAERGGKALKQAIEECTQSHSNLALLKRDKNAGVGGVLHEDDGDDSSGPSLAVILIDEVDLIFEADGDAGFWQSLSSVSKKAKCPIILTASSAPSQLENSSIQYLHSGLQRPTPLDCVSKMCQIAKMEGMKWQTSSHVDRDQIKEGMIEIAKLCGCDLRRIMNELQLYGMGHSQSRGPNILLPPSLSNCDEDRASTFATIMHPVVESISPGAVPSETYSVISIRGENFTEDTEARVTVGDQICPLAKILNDTTILAVVPPCQVPSDVDQYGYFRHNFEESICTRYASINVSIMHKNGMVLKSTSLVEKSNSTNDCIRANVFVQYSFPDRDESTMFTERHERNPNTQCNAVDLKELLHTAVQKFRQETKCEDRSEDKLCSPSAPLVSCSPMSQHGSVCNEMTDMAAQFERISDFVLLEQINDSLALPSLAGAVQGPQETENSDDISSVCGWRDPHLCKGSADVFMTRPTSRRDRQLISNELISKNEQYCFQLEASSSLCHEENKDDFLLSSFPPLEDESYLSLPIDVGSLMTSTQILERRKYDTIYSRSVDFGVSNWEKEGVWDVTTHLVEPILSKTRFLNDCRPQYCKLDYLPHLRNIAHFEKIADENYSALNIVEDSDDFQRKRRRTRRSAPKGRLHYFDEVLGRSKRSSDECEGKAIGKELAPFKLKYHKL